MKRLRNTLSKMDYRKYYLIFAAFIMLMGIVNYTSLTDGINQIAVFVVVSIMSIIMNISSLAAIFIWRTEMTKDDKLVITASIFATIFPQFYFFYTRLYLKGI